MKTKELKGKYGRPDWNPAVEFKFVGTRCLKLAIEEALDKIGVWQDEDEFIRVAIRDKLKELGIKTSLKPPNSRSRR